MLVITRKIGESIIIGDGIEVIVSEVGSDKVKLCINAPKEVAIVRKELLETSDLNKEAVRLPDDKEINNFKNLMNTKRKKSGVEKTNE